MALRRTLDQDMCRIRLTLRYAVFLIVVCSWNKILQVLMKKIRACLIFLSLLQLSAHLASLPKIAVWHVLILYSATLWKVAQDILIKSWPLARVTAVSNPSLFYSRSFLYMLSWCVTDWTHLSLLSYRQRPQHTRKHITRQENKSQSHTAVENCLVSMDIHIERNNSGALIKPIIKILVGLCPTLWETFRDGIKSLAGEGQTLPIISKARMEARFYLF